MKNGLKLLLVTLPIILLGVAVVALVLVYRPAPERNKLAERATAVRVVIARSQAVAPLATGFGIVHPARTYEAIAQVGGTAEYVNPALQKGAILPAGSVLLRLAQADFNLAIAQIQANIRAAEAKLAELSVSRENLSSALAIEKETLALKTADLERAETLFAGGTVSQSSRDTAQAAHLAQRQKVLSVESSLALLPTQHAVQAEQIAVYQVNLDTARLNLERTQLSLPFAARVASVSVEVGQFVRAGQTAALLDGIEAAEIDAQVSVAELRTLVQSTQPDTQAFALDPSAMTEVMRGLGLTAKVRLRLGSEFLQWPATVDRISDTIDQKTGTLGMIVRVDTPYTSAEPGSRPPLTKGMFVEVAMTAPPVEGVVVPRSALRNEQLMLADADDRLQLVNVSTRFVQGEIAVISDGLQPGERVIVSAPSPVMAGMLLAVTEDAALMAHLATTGDME
uniref:efflux RND transporter periplasmic adaptor subunit n=1 Tax=Pararhizobium sp. IMCC3301 TaxID=3067904 RepID=UPI002741CE0B|nr:hemolysin D [Pararhizobium sp. IMCC3301]